jgi:putative peptide zinc metalloprotease protein
VASSLFSPSWYRVQSLRPKLRRHVKLRRHDYRNRVWFILQDLSTGRSQRVSPAAYRLIGLMNGKRTLQSLWDVVNEQQGGRAPTQDEAIRLLGQLHAADAISCDVPPDTAEIFRRHEKTENQKLKQRFSSPMAIRIPLWDPDKFLTKTMPFARPFLTPAFGVVWLITIILGIVYAATNITAITENITDRVFTPSNLAVLWLVYPIVKAFHELGHGYMVKKNGGEVHEIGIMFLVFIPVPYVDASAASGFRSKHQRMLVGGMGIMAELFLAAIALFVWLNAESGAVTAVAYNVMLIGGVSTLFFNGNPLLRFDGYYVLADWLEIPNLGPRSNQHIGYVIQKYIFRTPDAVPVAVDTGERFWFIFYGIASFIYRMLIMFAIIAYVAGRFFFIGVLIAIWTMTMQIIMPAVKNMKFLFTSPKLRTHRPRAIFISGVVLAAILGFLLVMPAPYATVTDAVTWPKNQAQIRVGTSGFVNFVPEKMQPNVVADDLLLRVTDPFIEARRDLLLTELDGLEFRRSAVILNDRTEAALVSAEIEATLLDLARLDERLAEMQISSPRAGLAVLLNQADLQDRYLQQGAIIGYVVDRGDALSLRVAIDQDRIDLVRNHTEDVDVMIADWRGEQLKARIVREIPGGVMQLASPALGISGGGHIGVDPSDPQGTKTLERVFEFELEMDDADTGFLLGKRVWVRFDHGTLPLGFQMYRAFRQLFLRLYNV